MKTRLLHTMIRVKDLDRSVRFYTQVLGLEEARRTVLEKADATLVFLVDATGHHPIELTFNHDGRDYELGTQFGHFALGVDDLVDLPHPAGGEVGHLLVPPDHRACVEQIAPEKSGGAYHSDRALLADA